MEIPELADVSVKVEANLLLVIVRMSHRGLVVGEILEHTTMNAGKLLQCLQDSSGVVTVDVIGHVEILGSESSHSANMLKKL